MNVYVLSYCPLCEKFHYGSQLMLHGGRNIDKVKKLMKEGKTISEIYQSFCGYCGEYIEGTECPCKHTNRQHYYED